MGGLNIHYIDIGQGRTIVFLHGWGGSTASFLGVARAISSQYRCVLVDFAGFGETPEPTLPYTLDDYTNDLDALLDELNIKECFFVAHSFGGRVAIKYLTQNRKCRVKGAVLVDSAGLKPKRKLGYYLRVLKYKLYKALGKDTSNMGSDDYKALSPIMRTTFVNIVNEYLDNKLNNIHLPVLLYWGEEDMDTPLYMAHRMNKLMDNSALIVLKGRGHFAYLEEGDRFVRVLLSYLEGID